ncbi:MAG: PEP-CTERM sorting domain-containing protein [Desulfobacter sp.]|nr:MAG: PEP-CTERM sorting domain-containing protein [Desulfobacter sp.]
MKRLQTFFIIVCGVAVAAGSALAGPYTEAGIPGFVDGTINPVFQGWATGFLNYTPAPALDPDLDGQYTQGGGVSTEPNRNYRTPEKALGPVTGSNMDIVSLGDLWASQIDAGISPGEITLTFDAPIMNGSGDDFAVFENGFYSGSDLFAELGYVDVSTDGINFARFGSVSLTPGPVGGYGGIDPSDVHNLAGKHPNAYGSSEGTGFDLEELSDNALVLSGLVDLDDINFVRIVDIPGSGDFLDSQGNPIYDSWVTWGSGGVDLEAVGVINQAAAVPIPGAFWLLGTGLLVVARSRRN